MHFRSPPGQTSCPTAPLRRVSAISYKNDSNDFVFCFSKQYPLNKICGHLERGARRAGGLGKLMQFGGGKSLRSADSLDSSTTHARAERKLLSKRCAHDGRLMRAAFPVCRQGNDFRVRRCFSICPMPSYDRTPVPVLIGSNSVLAEGNAL